MMNKINKSIFIKNLIFAVATTTLATSMFAQNTDTIEYFSNKTLRYEDHTYVKNLRTIQLSPEPNALTPPLILLNSEEKLLLNFDDLDGDYKTYNYTITHCNAKWEPSNILVSEFLDGFAENTISDYSFSRNTLQKYTHYNAEFPNQNFKLTKSGNYLLIVYTDNNIENICFSKRFMVFENKVDVNVSIHAATIVENRNFKQEIDFKIIYSPGEITNPYQEIYPVILQNFRWDNAIFGLSPQYVKDLELIYDYDDQNVFGGSSEFRWFDTRSLRYQSDRINKIEKGIDSIYNVWLLPDEKRTYKRYVGSNDINGKYLIKTNDGGSDAVDADYTWIHFFLPYDPATTEGTMYVFGAFSNWQSHENYRMKYNALRKGYEASILLKQGYYNYEFVLLRTSTKELDDIFTEGMHQETENDYFILVYFRRQGSWVDELVGFKRTNSRPQ